MLVNTFSHIPGIGLKTEKRLWREGVTDWDAFTERPLPFHLPAALVATAQDWLARSREALAAEDLRFFTAALAPTRHWRIFPTLRESTAYLDIETTGLAGPGDHITTIALFDGSSIQFFVHGENLDDFPEAVARYKVLVTYNGRCFDIPFIEQAFGIHLTQAHIDLRYVLRGLGYTGGLKLCEQRMGLHRGDLDGVDGFFAVLLWREYRRSGNRRALQTLLAYNIADVLGLETLLVKAYNEHLTETPFASTHALPWPEPPPSPFAPDTKLIAEIRGHLRHER